MNDPLSITFLVVFNNGLADRWFKQNQLVGCCLNWVFLLISGNWLFSIHSSIIRRIQQYNLSNWICTTVPMGLLCGNCPSVRQGKTRLISFCLSSYRRRCDRRDQTRQGSVTGRHRSHQSHQAKRNENLLADWRIAISPECMRHLLR